MAGGVKRIPGFRSLVKCDTALRTPTSAARRVKNRAVGRLLARGGIWRRLWRSHHGRTQDARPVPNTCPKTKTSPVAVEGTSKGTSP